MGITRDGCRWAAMESCACLVLRAHGSWVQHGLAVGQHGLYTSHEGPWLPMDMGDHGSLMGDHGPRWAAMGAAWAAMGCHGRKAVSQSESTYK